MESVQFPFPVLSTTRLGSFVRMMKGNAFDERKVLIVDDNVELLHSLEEGLGGKGRYAIVTAEDGLIAQRKLKENVISLVVTDLKMPRIDGLGLLAHIMEKYPDIPVILITAYGTPTMERLARDGGLAGFIEKPFEIIQLDKLIMDILRRESEGGILHNVSPGTFLQLIEMEETTATIRLVEKTSGKQGVLFFSDGRLLNARVNGLQGKRAAYEILAWDDVTLSIQNICPHKKNRIEEDLQALLLEAMRLKDEAEGRDPAFPHRFEDEQTERAPGEETLEKARFIRDIRNELERELSQIEEEQEGEGESEPRPERDYAYLKTSFRQRLRGWLRETFEALGRVYRFTVRLFALLFAICILTFCVLYFSMEKEDELRASMNQTESLIESDQEKVSEINGELKEIKAQIEEMEHKGGDASRTTKIELMDLNLKLYDLQEEKKQLSADLELLTNQLERNRSKLNEMKRKDFWQRLLRR